MLSKNNFKVVGAVRRESKTTHVFGIGGMSKDALIADAKVKMLDRVNFIGSSKAIINETVELKHSLYFLLQKIGSPFLLM